MSKKSLNLIVLTGPPGCGKTTLVKNVCGVLKTKNVALNGFFTEEIRAGRERIGFDVVLLDGKRAPLARVESGSCLKPTVGKYAVDVNSFESCVLPVLRSKEETSVLVLDGFRGKMELLSEKFKVEVTKRMDCGCGVILATVPFKTPRPIPLVENIKSHPNTCLITVDKNNRDMLTGKIIDLIVNANTTWTDAVEKK